MKIQSFDNDTNLDSLDGKGEVWTRKPTLTHQTWDLDEVGKTSGGTGIFTIKDETFSKYLTAHPEGKQVSLEDGVSGELSQQWVVDRAEEQTTIVSWKFKDGLLQENGVDKAVTLVEAKGTPTDNQLWSVSELHEV